MPRRNKQIKITRTIVQNNCDAKRRYISENEAIKAADYQMLINQNLELSTYKCNLCFKWHLTKRQG